MQGIQQVGKPQGSDTFFHRIETTVAPGKPLQITLILLVERLPGEDGSGALLMMDSIDCEIHDAPKKSFAGRILGGLSPIRYTSVPDD